MKKLQIITTFGCITIGLFSCQKIEKSPDYVMQTYHLTNFSTYAVINGQASPRVDKGY